MKLLFIVVIVLSLILLISAQCDRNGFNTCVAEAENVCYDRDLYTFTSRIVHKYYKSNHMSLILYRLCELPLPILMEPDVSAIQTAFKLFFLHVLERTIL